MYREKFISAYDGLNGTRTWVFNMRKVLNEHGFMYIFDNCKGIYLKGFDLFLRKDLLISILKNGMIN